MKQYCPIDEGDIGRLILKYFHAHDNYLEKVVHKYVPKIVDIIIKQENININSKK